METVGLVEDGGQAAGKVTALGEDNGLSCGSKRDDDKCHDSKVSSDNTTRIKGFVFNETGEPSRSGRKITGDNSYLSICQKHFLNGGK